MADRIAIVTGEDVPELTDGARRLRETFGRRGRESEAVVWTDGAVDWTTFDVALLRSCWGYYTRPERLRRWIDAVEDAGTVVLNPPAIVRWNLHKSYLLDLEGEGVPIVPTEVVPSDADRRLEAILRDRDWDRAVVKPVIGTSAAGTWRTSRETAATDQDRFEARFRAGRKVGTSADGPEDDERLSERGALVQRFVPEVADGELSLVFFANEFSHAWRSQRASAALGVDATASGTDATTDEETGPFDPGETLRDEAAEVLLAAGNVLGVDPTAFAYARVDGIVRDGKFHLMELELVEPYLRLEQTETAVVALATAVEAALDERRGA